MRTCFLIGHRYATEDILPALNAAIERHITQYGVTSFTVGHYGGFDRLAARALREAKSRHPEISLTLLLPYHPTFRPVTLPKDFDGSFYPPGMEDVPLKLAIVRVNRYTLDHSDYLIAYANAPGNTRELLDYAQRRARRGLLHVEALTNGHG